MSFFCPDHIPHKCHSFCSKFQVDLGVVSTVLTPKPEIFNNKIVIYLLHKPQIYSNNLNDKMGEKILYKPFRDTNLCVCVCFWSIRHILDKCHKWSAWIMLWFIWNWFMNYVEVGCAWNEKFTRKSIGGIKSKNISICLKV